MRRVAELLLLLASCIGASLLLHWHTISRPMLISGTMIDWTTGRPVPGVTVRYMQVNGSSEAAHTDANGNFSAVAPEEGRPYLLYASDPRFGTVLQSTFGRVVVVYSRGEQHSGVIVPAIPSAEVSGHVYDEESGAPIPACEVSVLTTGPDNDGQFENVEFGRTDHAGAYSFRLGADRYFFLVRCRRYLSGEVHGADGIVYIPWRVRRSWAPMMLPKMPSDIHAEGLVLLPGARRDGLDFHLRSVPQYSIHGRVIFSDGSKPRAGVVYLHDLEAIPLDPSVTAAERAVKGGPCDWNANAGTFHCDFLVSGMYRLTFISDGAVERDGFRSQRADEVVEVKSEATNKEITVQLHDIQFRQRPNAPLPESGKLDVQRVCPNEIDSPWIDVQAWGPTVRNVGMFWKRGCSEETTFRIAPGEYSVTAFQTEFFGRRRSPKLLSLLRRRGVAVIVQDGHTSRLPVPVLRTEDIIHLALKSLVETRAQR